MHMRCTDLPNLKGRAGIAGESGSVVLGLPLGPLQPYALPWCPWTSCLLAGVCNVSFLSFGEKFEARASGESQRNTRFQYLAKKLILHTFFANVAHELEMRFDLRLFLSFVRLVSNHNAARVRRQTEKNNPTRANTRVHPRRPLASQAQAAQVCQCPP